MKFEIYKDNSGEWRWRLKAANGETLAVSSESYKNRKDAIEIVATIKDACARNKANIFIEKK